MQAMVTKKHERSLGEFCVSVQSSRRFQTVAMHDRPIEDGSASGRPLWMEFLLASFFQPGRSAIESQVLREVEAAEEPEFEKRDLRLEMRRHNSRSFVRDSLQGHEGDTRWFGASFFMTWMISVGSFGFNWYLVVNDRGERLRVQVTAGDTDDRSPVRKLCRGFPCRKFITCALLATFRSFAG